MKYAGLKRETPPQGWRRAGDAITGGEMSLIPQSLRVAACGSKVFEGSTC